MTEKKTQEPLIYTTQDTLGNKTGSWRYMRPVFETKAAPCAAICPAGNPIVSFITFAKEGDFDSALRMIKQENPLPSVCGRVCPHPCTSACNRYTYDGSVAINEIERFCGDFAEQAGPEIPERAGATGKKIAVVGAGPAGLSCAYQAALMGHEVTILEASNRAGGLLTQAIPAYRLPAGVVRRDLCFIDILNIILLTGKTITASDIEKMAADYDAVAVACGAHKSYRLGIEGEELAGVVPGLEFLRKMSGRAAPAPGAKTVVIGGGNTAMDAARAALRLGAEVTVLYRRTRAEMPAFPGEILEAEEEGIEFRFLSAPVKIETSGKTKKVICREMELGSDDDSGRPRPVPVEGSEFELDADTVITAIGETVALDAPFFSPNENRRQISNAWGRTTNDRIFICGDAGPNDRTVAHAVGSGKRAAIAIDAQLSGKDFEAVKQRITLGGGAVSAAIYRSGAEAPAKVVAPQAVNFAYFMRTARLEAATTAPDERIKGFGEIGATAAEDAVRAEAARCFTCGVCTECGNCFMFCPDMSIITEPRNGVPATDTDYCKGCGICARECPRGIIEMEEENK